MWMRANSLIRKAFLIRVSAHDKRVYRIRNHEAIVRICTVSQPLVHGAEAYAKCRRQVCAEAHMKRQHTGV